MKENQEATITVGKMNIIGITECTTQKTYIPIVDLCNYLGINSNMQIKRMKSDIVLKDNIKIIPIQTNNGIKSKFCLDIYALPFYLINIDESKCKNDISKKLLDLKLASREILNRSSIDINNIFGVKINNKKERILELEELILNQSKDDLDKNEVIDNNKKFLDLNTVCKIFDIKEFKLVQICKDFGLLKENNLPKEEYISKGWFKILLENIGYGKDCIAKPTIKITPLGLIRIKNILVMQGELN